jgi:hypothetical protein
MSRRVPLNLMLSASRASGPALGLVLREVEPGGAVVPTSKDGQVIRIAPTDPHATTVHRGGALRLDASDPATQSATLSRKWCEKRSGPNGIKLKP